MDTLSAIPISKAAPVAEAVKPPTTAEALRVAILAQYDWLSPRRQQIGRYILDEPNAMDLDSLAVIASRIAVQPSAMARFA